MKCKKANTDQEIELTVYANGQACAEYVLPSATDTQQDILECFIPVEVGNDLTICGQFSGSCLQASFDFLADGAFLADRTINAPKSGEIKAYSQRKVEFKSVLNAPKPPGYTSLLPPEKIVEGNLHVKDMDDGSETTTSDSSATAHGVGSLVVVVSMTQDPNEKYTRKYGSITCGERVEARETVMTGGIPPAFELEFKTTKDDLSKHRQTKHKKHAEQARFGDQPWATFIFYYRSQTILEAYDCSERETDHIHELDPYKGTFVYGTTEKRAKGEGAKRDDDENSSIFVGERSSALPTPALPASNKPTPVPELPDGQAVQHSPVQPVTPVREKHQAIFTPSTPSKTSPPGRKKLMGQSLNLPLSHIQRGSSALPGQGEDMSEFERTLRTTTESKIQKLQTSTSPTPARTSHVMAATGSDMPGDELRKVVDGAEAFPSSPLTHPSAAPVAHMISSTTSKAYNDVDEQVNDPDAEGAAMHVKAEEGDLFLPARTTSTTEKSNLPSDPSTPLTIRPDHNMTSSQLPLRGASQAVEGEESDEEVQPKFKATIDDIRALIPGEGITLFNLYRMLGDELAPSNRAAKEVFAQGVKQVVYQKDGKYYVKPAAWSQKSSQASPSPKKHNSKSGSTPGSGEASTPAETATVKAPAGQAEGDSAVKVDRANSRVKAETPHSPIPAKRPASRISTTREPTPSSKKGRFDDIAAQKAELLRLREEKRKRNATSHQALAQQRKAREEAERLREEAEERELAMLQQQMVDDDAEYEDLEQQREEEAEAER